MRTIQNFCTQKNSPSAALRDLAHKPLAVVLIVIFDFCCRVSHTTTVSGDEKSLALKLISRGTSWPKVPVGGKAM